jgi:hypothetical protein
MEPPLAFPEEDYGVIHIGFLRVTQFYAWGLGRFALSERWIMTAAEPLPIGCQPHHRLLDEMASLHERPDRIKETKGGDMATGDYWQGEVNGHSDIFVGARRNRIADLPISIFIS